MGASTSKSEAALVTAGVVGGAAALYALRRRRQPCEVVIPECGAILTEEDLKYIDIVQDMVYSTPKPMHSNFLVTAVLAYRDAAGRRQHVRGCNTETCVLQASLCAERCAMVQLRLQPGGYQRVDTVYISASVEEPITPGFLCREMLQEVAHEGTRVILVTPAWRPHSSTGRCAVYMLSELYGLPSVYHRVGRDALPSFIQAFKAGMQPVNATTVGAALAATAVHEGAGVDMQQQLQRLRQELPARACEAYAAAVSLAATPGIAADQLHPTHYAAAVVFSNGRLVTARHTKGLEYGCTVDAAVKLVREVETAAHAADAGTSSSGSSSSSSSDEQRRGAAVTPVLLLVADQHGVLHAPTAVPRAWFHEQGHGATLTLAHDSSGQLRAATISALAPLSPAITLTK